MSGGLGRDGDAEAVDGGGRRYRALDIAVFDEEDESPFVALWRGAV